MSSRGEQKYTSKVYSVYIMVRKYLSPWNDDYPEEKDNTVSLIDITEKIYEWLRSAVRSRESFKKILPDLEKEEELADIIHDNPWAFYCALSRTTKNYMVGVKAAAWNDLDDLYQQEGITAEEVALAQSFAVYIEKVIGPEYEKEFDEKHRMRMHVRKGMQRSRQGEVVEEEAGKGKGKPVLQQGPQRPRLVMKTREEVEERDVHLKCEDLQRQLEEANAKLVDRNALPRDTSNDAQSSQMKNLTPVPQSWNGKGGKPPQRPPGSAGQPAVPWIQPRPPAPPVVPMQVDTSNALSYYNSWSASDVGPAGLFPQGSQGVQPTTELQWGPTHPKATPAVWDANMDWDADGWNHNDWSGQENNSWAENPGSTATQGVQSSQKERKAMLERLKSLNGKFETYSRDQPLKEFKLVEGSWEERREKGQLTMHLLNGNWKLYTMRQKGNFANITDRREYLQYMANFHAYLIAELPHNPMICIDGQSQQTVLEHGHMTTYPMVIDEVFRAWNDIKDMWFQIHIDYFNVSGGLMFEIGAVHQRHYFGLNKEEQQRKLGEKAVSVEIVRRYLMMCQDNKLKGSGKMWSYLIQHTLEGQTHKTLIPYALLSGQIDLVTDDEEPFIKFVVTNIHQPKLFHRDGVYWKKEEERFPTIEENLIVRGTSKAFSKKTAGYTFKRCGPNLDLLYRENSDEKVNVFEKMRHDALKQVFEDGEKARKGYDEKRH